MAEKKLEKQIERAVCRYAADRYKMLTFKWSSPARVGVTDRIFITIEGLIAFVEFKAEGKRDQLTTLQRRTLDLLTEYRCEVFVIDSIESGRQLVDLLSNAEAYAAVRYGRDSEIIVPPQLSS